MKDRIKDIILIVLFCFVIIFGFFLNIYLPDEKISISERRYLKQIPNINNIFKGTYVNDFESYAIDQFCFKDRFRELKEFVHFNIYRQSDNNGIFVKNNSIYKQMDNLNENEILKATNKYKEIKEKYFKNSQNVYFSIVPDKNYYLENSNLRFDYEKLEKLMQEELKNDVKYIDIFDTLNVDSYYKTDSHWKQETLEKTVNKILSGMENDTKIDINEIALKGTFEGVYGSQLASNKTYDELKYVLNDNIINAITYNYETGLYNQIYDENKWKTSFDKYDFFLSGATAIIEINNNIKKDGKELVIFRDSFASSIAPLFLEGYFKITLIDLRYINTDYINEFVKFNNLENIDVLFLNSTIILNESSMFK